ncbi:MAG: YbaB/EbfC family nucleoid-associated protein [Kibdelosporangium sp.]
MTTVDRSRVEMLRQEYERQRAGLADLQRRLAELSVTIVSSRREVSVTVGSQSVIKDLKFPTNAYKRLAPNELAALIMRTITEAREKVIDQTAEIMTPMLPADLNARDLLTGTVDHDRFTSGEPRIPPMVRDRMDRTAVRDERNEP